MKFPLAPCLALALLGWSGLGASPVYGEENASVSDLSAQLLKMTDGSAETVPGFKKARGLLLLKLARRYRDNGNLPVAEAVYRNALAYLKDSLGLYDTNVTQCLNELAQTLRQEKLFQEAQLLTKQQNVIAIALAGSPPREQSQYIPWLKNSSELGHPSSATLLGLAFLKGEGVAVDLLKARQYLEKAVEQADGCGEVNLALLYQNGKGVQKDQSKADQYFSLAKSYGVFYPSTGSDNNGNAQFQLGLASETGVGLRKEPGAAFMWYSLAVESGCSDAAEASRRLGVIKNGLSPEELDQYQQQLSTWKDQQRLALFP